MKQSLKIILLFFTLLFTINGFAQGIQFEDGKWADIIAKAKKTNKPIFVDVYTSWCGPCKQMAKNIFPLKEVGDKYNLSFVCYKIDAEKGEGIEIAKKYNVKGFPCFLYIKPDGTLIHKAVGFKITHEFLSEADFALQKTAPVDAQQSLADYQAAFDAGERNPDFLVTYMNRRAQEKLSNIALADTLFEYLSPEQRMQPPYTEILTFNAGNFYSPLYAFIANHCRDILKTLNPAVYNNIRFKLRGVADKIVGSYHGKPDPYILETVIKIYNGILDMSQSKDREYLYQIQTLYYKNVSDTSGFLNNAHIYAADILFPQNNENLQKAAGQMIETARQQLAKNEIDSSEYKSNSMRAAAMTEVAARRTIDLAIDIAEMAKTKDDLQFADRLALHAVEINDNPLVQSGYAVVIAQSGNKKEAKKIVEKAMGKAKESNSKLLPGIQKNYEKIMK